ncbi:leukocyte elastase inhibitor A-like [Planococcus citri]|uniref:leukocyte elastase inhibitor A-like n=1 Tax=Planococcus citri TaxID=170843 RepID=UPI0031F7360E
MSPMKTLILSLLFVLGTICHSHSEQQVLGLQNSIAKLNAVFAKNIKDDLKPEQNALFSPFNIYTALSLLHLGTSGETRKELTKALGLVDVEVGLSAQQNYFRKILNGLQTSKAAEVKIANTLFVQNGLKLKESYLKTSKNYYQSEPQELDFAKGGPEATNLVNNWVSNNTKNRIPQLFKNQISPATSLLLVSALFFNATWNEPFKKSATKNETFNTGVKQVDVPLMNQKGYVPYFKSDDLKIEAISLPYENKEFNMLIFLPYQNHSVSAVIDAYKPQYHQQLPQGVKWNNEYVDYKIPRLKFGWSQSINNHVIKAGITKIFGSAELDNLVEENASNLRVSDITHATEIQVDEDGTVATAATSIQGVRVSLEFRPDPIKFYVDRPFVISIYHGPTSMILFTGIVQNPLV